MKKIMSKDSVIIQKLMNDLDQLVDENSEIRYVNTEKKAKILVDKDCADIGFLRVFERNKYVNVVKSLGKHPKYFYKPIGRILLNIEDKTKIAEHINGNPLDNRRCNLRICDQGKNTKNRKPYSLKTEYKGLSIGNNWKSLCVEIQNEGIRYRVQFNQSLIEKIGAIIYDVMALRLHGEFSRTNLLKSEYEKDICDFLYDIVKNNISELDKRPIKNPALIAEAGRYGAGSVTDLS